MSERFITKKINVVNINKGIRKNLIDEVVEEYSLSISVNGIFMSTLICSRYNLKELAVGHLFSNGLISGICDIVSIDLVENESRAEITLNIENKIFNSENADKNRKIITSSNGRQFSYNEDIIKKIQNKDRSLNRLKFDSKKILDEVKTFAYESEVFNKTGGIHSCKICSPDGFTIHMEDIGRHNAFDKVVGSALMVNLDFSNSYIITSGRVPSDMVIKAVISGVPLLVSKSAPTNISVQIAQENGLILIGFARGERLNIYTFSERIV